MNSLKLTIPVTIPSQNVRESRWHWRQRWEHRRLCQWHVMALTNGRCTRPFAEKVLMRITSVRPKRMSDKANLVGGCKGLVDAVVQAGLLVDDSDEHVKIDYRQETLRGRKPHTVLEFLPLEGEGDGHAGS